jgi:hypothetical protein
MEAWMTKFLSRFLIQLVIAIAFGMLPGTLIAGGTLSGTLTYDGIAGPLKFLNISKDKTICGKEPHHDESLMVGENKGLKNVVISLQGVTGDTDALGTEFTLNQSGCVFTPHVQLLPAGVAIKVFNNDGILHNIHTFSKKNPAINIAQPKFIKKIERSFKSAEIIPLKCDVHGWMQAFVVVVDHPYHAVTAADGSYAITGIPLGTYQVELWHETLGLTTQEVVITAEGATRLDHVYPER